MSTVSPDSVAQDQLRAFVERIERLEEERKAIAKDIAEVYAEAKGNGFDRTALKTVVRIRATDHAERMEREAIVNLYLDALGMAPVGGYEDEVGTRLATRAPAPATRHETSQHDAGGAEDEAQVATFGAPSSAQPIEPQSGLRAETAAQTVQPIAAVATSETQTESVESSVGGESDGKSLPVPNTEPETAPPGVSEAGDRGAVTPPAAATVVAAADRTKPHPFCNDPEECGAEASWNHMCLSCHRRMEKALQQRVAA